jgi:hypothetical protein
LASAEGLSRQGRRVQASYESKQREGAFEEGLTEREEAEVLGLHDGKKPWSRPAPGDSPGLPP